MSVPVDHPPPWRWGGSNGEHCGGWLCDANDEWVMAPANPEVVEFASPAVRELLAAAPEMETLLRGHVTGDASEPGCLNEIIDFLCESPPPNGGRGVGQGDVERMLKVLRSIRDRADTLLARLDEARKAGG